MIGLEDIIKKLEPTQVIGDKTKLVKRVVKFVPDKMESGDIAWVNEKNKEQVYNSTKGIVICPHTVDVSKLKGDVVFLLHTNPRSAFRSLLVNFFTTKKQEAFISPTAKIGKNVVLGSNVYIGHNTVLEDNITIGNNVVILYNNSILSDTIIGNSVQIGSNNTIGGVGFGYEKDEQGNYEVLPHIGNVVIEDNVEIGNNTCIDRAVLGSTLLKKNCKIDNLVHIAHGVEIGENSLIIAHAMIGGSSIIGNNVWVAPNVSIINKVSVGDGSTVGLSAVVIKNVGAGETVVGNPAKPIVKK